MKILELSEECIRSTLSHAFSKWYYEEYPELDPDELEKLFTHSFIKHLQAKERLLLPRDTVVDKKPDEIQLWPEDLHALIKKMIETAIHVSKFTRNDLLAHCLSLGFFSIVDLLATESVAAITLPFKGNPRQPNRDHVCHVLAVQKIMPEMIKLHAFSVHGIPVIDRLVDKLTEDDCILSGYIREWKLGKREVINSIERAIPIMSLCHDLLYPLEVSLWVIGTGEMNKLKQAAGIFDDNGSDYINAVKQSFKNGVYPEFSEKLSDLDKRLRKVERWFVEGIKDNSNILDHGQKAAVLLLSAFTKSIFWDHFFTVDKFAVLLASLSIFNHCNFAKKREKRKRPLSKGDMRGKYTSKKMWKDDPTGVVLALADHLAEAPRTHWAIASNPKAGPNSEKWIRTIDLHHALCINKCRIEVDDKMMSAIYSCNVKNKYPKDPAFGPDVTYKRFDAEEAIKEDDKEETCRELAEQIWGGCRSWINKME